MIINGMELSSETNLFNINKIKENNIKFVMIRIGFTDYDSNKTKIKDKNFDYNYKLAKKYNIKKGVYYTSRATNIEEVDEEIDFIMKLIEKINFEYPLVIELKDDHNTVLYNENSQKKIIKINLSDIEKYFIYKLKSCCDIMIRTYSSWINFIYLEECKYWIDN